MISTSYDGTVRCFDLDAQKVLLIYGDEEDDAYTTYHAQLDAHTFLVTLGSSGNIGVVDIRESNMSMSRMLPVFPRISPKTVDIHPLKRDLFLAPNNKAECAIFDIRSTKKSGLMNPILKLCGHTKSISSAFFSPVSGKSICTVSYDDRVRLFCSYSNEKEFHPYKSIVHNNQTGRWLTTFKAEWHPARDDMFFIGCMKQPRQIDVFSDQGYNLGPLKGDDLGSVCSIVKCHPTMDFVVGGNSSGRVHVFM